MVYDDIHDLMLKCLKKTPGNSDQRNTMLAELEHIEKANYERPYVWLRKVKEYAEAYND